MIIITRKQLLERRVHILRELDRTCEISQQPVDGARICFHALQARHGSFEQPLKSEGPLRHPEKSLKLSNPWQALPLPPRAPDVERTAALIPVNGARLEAHGGMKAVGG